MTAAAMKEAFANAEPINIWPVPDMSLVDNGRRPPVPMPGEVFGPVWSIIGEIADATATAPDYAALGYLTAAASVIGGKRRISPYGSDWTEPCILWAAALGDPSSRKSAPLDMITKPLWAIEEAAREEHDADMREWSAEAERAKAEKAKWAEDIKKVAGTGDPSPEMPALAVEPDKPHERRVMLSDVTPEAAAAVLAGNPQGVLCYNDELQQWIDGFDRYNAGGRSFWLAAYGGRPYSVTRKGGGSIHVPFNGMSVLGSIQPDRIVPLLAGANDGLIARILWAWPDKLPPSRPTGRVNMEALKSVYLRLDQLAWGLDAEGKRTPVVLPLSEHAASLFHQWEVANASSDGDGGSLYEAFVGKMSGTALRLALVCELTRWAFSSEPEPGEVSTASVAAAIKWCEDYAKPMAARVYGDAAVPESDRNAALLARYVRKQKLEIVNLRALRLHPHKQHLKPLLGKGAMNEAAEALVDAGWFMPAPSRDGDGPGRERKDFRVNPAVLGRG